MLVWKKAPLQCNAKVLPVLPNSCFWSGLIHVERGPTSRTGKSTGSFKRRCRVPTKKPPVVFVTVSAEAKWCSGLRLLRVKWTNTHRTGRNVLGQRKKVLKCKNCRSLVAQRDNPLIHFRRRRTFRTRFRRVLRPWPLLHFAVHCIRTCTTNRFITDLPFDSGKLWPGLTLRKEFWDKFLSVFGLCADNEACVKFGMLVHKAARLQERLRSMTTSTPCWTAKSACLE